MMICLKENKLISTRGTGTVKRHWLGVWYKPWTWLKFYYVIQDDYKLIDICLVSTPKE